jgi:hypothetical protein
MNNSVEPRVWSVINRYPEIMRERVIFLRQLIIEAATEIQLIDSLEETLKWGEPAYLTKMGSTVRIAWNAAKPDQYGMYFHCQTKLLDTFRQIYADVFHFEGNRAILFHENDTVPAEELKHCISLALNYHRLKHLPLLGV